MANKMTNKKALEVLMNAQFMCLNGNAEDFRQAVEVGFSCILKSEKLEVENLRLKATIKSLKENK